MSNESQNTPQASMPQRAFRVVSQAIEDFSFENINFAKPILRNDSKQVPEISIGINVKTSALAENPDLHIVNITLKINSKLADTNLFILELSYGGIFEVIGFEEEIFLQILNIQAPNLLFPFMRQIVADATANGGYPPLYLEPIDFAGLYFQNQETSKKQSAE